MRLINSDEMKIKGYMRLSGYTVTNRLIDKVVDSVPTVQAVPISVIENIKAEIEFQRDRKIGGEFFEAVQYRSFDKCLDIIDKHIRKENE